MATKKAAEKPVGAEKNENKQKALEMALAQIEKNYGKGAKEAVGQPLRKPGCCFFYEKCRKNGENICFFI